VRSTTREVRRGFDSKLRSVSAAAKTQKNTDCNADKDRDTARSPNPRAREGFLRKAELEIKALQKELHRYHGPAAKTAAA